MGSSRVFSRRDAIGNPEHDLILSVVIITYNEERNIGRALASVKPMVADGKGEIIVVDSGSSDRTVEIANAAGAKVFAQGWKGYATQKNFSIQKAAGDWILSLDADEEVSAEAAQFILDFTSGKLATRFDGIAGVRFNRRNYFLGRWIRRGGFYPDPKLRLFRRDSGAFEARAVHEDVKMNPGKRVIHSSFASSDGDRIYLSHHSYPTLEDYLDHMNRYSSLGAEMVVARGGGSFSLWNIVVRPAATFFYNYFLRLGFLDGREGFLLHIYHAVYVSWKYSKAWELKRQQRDAESTQ